MSVNLTLGNLIRWKQPKDFNLTRKMAAAKKNAS